VLIVNPFSPEAERIVKKHQTGGNPEREVFEHAKKLVGWKASGERRMTIPQFLVSGYDIERDILAQRLLFLTIALNFTPFSNELRLVKESFKALTKARLSAQDLTNEAPIIGLLSDLFKIKAGSPTFDGGMKFDSVFVEKKELYTGSRVRYGEPWRTKYAVDWKELIRLVGARQLRFVDLYLVKGLALLSLNDLIEYYSRLISLRIEDFITLRFEEFRGRSKSEDIKSLAIETSDLAEYLSTAAGKSFRGAVLQGTAGRLKPENFPPCIRAIISGVETGSRNYAISVVLTSFLSYARIAPKKVQEPRIQDYVKDPRVLTDEILPMIFEAAALCSPPLFEDQPGERLNVNYHLGLGLTSQVKLENSGSSHWYFPPNCEKIRRESPSMCRPDETCKNIKNPLTYYFVKFKKEKGSSGEGGAE
jgi:DNA primase large subunit